MANPNYLLISISLSETEYCPLTEQLRCRNWKKIKGTIQVTGWKGRILEHKIMKWPSIGGASCQSEWCNTISSLWDLFHNRRLCLLSNSWKLFILDKTFFFLQSVQFSSVQSLNCVWHWDPTDCSTPGLPVPSATPGVYSNSCPLSQWCHPTISSSIVPFSSCPQSFPASGSFQMSQLFTSGGQSTGVLASASVLPMNIQDWFPLRWTGWISLQSKGLSRVFSNTTVQKHQFFGTQPSS